MTWPRMGILLFKSKMKYMYIQLIIPAFMGEINLTLKKINKIKFSVSFMLLIHISNIRRSTLLLAILYHFGIFYCAYEANNMVEDVKKYHVFNHKKMAKKNP